MSKKKKLFVRPPNLTSLTNRYITCALCGQLGGTMVKVDEEGRKYRHAVCPVLLKKETARPVTVPPGQEIIKAA